MAQDKNTRPITYSIDQERGVAIATWHGDVTAADIRRHWNEYFSNKDVLVTGRSVADVREANFRFTGRELANILEEVVAPLLRGREWRTAIVVARPAQFGVSKQFDVFAGSFVTNQIFYDLDEALAWVTR